jgi:hypothetical protein
MYSADVRIGRLIEARLFTLETVDQVAQFETVMREAFSKTGGKKAVICADWRQANVLRPDVADRLIGLLTRGNTFLERSAVLLAREHATFNLQVERLVREANNPARKTFRATGPLEIWLDEVLDSAERIRLRDFLGG